jgi:diguanylate cyclase
MNHSKTLRVLFVEDSEDDKELVLGALRSEYADIVHQRVDTADALRMALIEMTWDVILCDHSLPKLNAPKALRIVQEYGPEIPFLIVSGSIENDAVAAAMMAGAADMISKDHLPRLVPAVKRELEKSTALADLRQARAHIRQMSYYDQLTGLPNREFLARSVEHLIGVSGPANARGDTFALMVINLSRFLLIPRTLGAEAGNQTLRLVGERIRKCIGDAGLVASLSGDKYAVLLSAYRGHAQLLAILDRLNEEISRPLKMADRELFLATRTGISLYPQDGRDFHKLIINAEIAMSQVQTDGGRNHKFFDPGMNAADQKRLTLEHAVHRALKQKEFSLHYQPQFDVRSGALVGAEALMRWQTSDGNWISPTEFIPVLEETGLIVPLGEWALKTACLQNLAWQNAGFAPIRIAVNLSAIQFRQAELVPMVRRVLAETGLDRRYLELEITENIAMHNEESVIDALSELNDMGISLAIDDFGTGYSSLSYLKRFPVHKLKIDRSFVNGITASDDGSIVQAIIALACNLKLEVIAEGVETEPQMAFLRSCGCNEVQGFLFSQPLPAEKMERFLGPEGTAPCLLLA